MGEDRKIHESKTESFVVLVRLLWPRNDEALAPQRWLYLFEYQPLCSTFRHSRLPSQLLNFTTCCSVFPLAFVKLVLMKTSSHTAGNQPSTCWKRC